LVYGVLEGLQEQEVGVALGGWETANLSVELEDGKLSSFVESESGDPLDSEGGHSDDGSAGAGLERGFRDAPVSDVEVELEPVTAARVPALSDVGGAGESSAVVRLPDVLPKKLGVHACSTLRTLLILERLLHLREALTELLELITTESRGGLV
jgi:hypothetical protein